LFRPNGRRGTASVIKDRYEARYLRVAAVDDAIAVVIVVVVVNAAAAVIIVMMMMMMMVMMLPLILIGE